MKSLSGIVILIIGMITIETRAFPANHNRSNAVTQQNITSSARVMQSVSPTVETITKAIDRSIVNVIRDSLALQVNLATSTPREVSDVTIAFPQLQLAGISCEPFQITERMQTYLTALARFTQPMNLILSETQWSLTQRQMLLKLSNSMTWLRSHHINMLESFAEIAKEKTVPISISQLDTTTRSYMARHHPSVSLTENQMKAIRTISFLKAMSKVVQTILSETSIAMPFSQ